ncbi:MAG: tRNA (adenosine(37)-N6)-threonylcarbamoyltransferase complex transferase subunit TsaD [Elusimicrobiota bacterium]
MKVLGIETSCDETAAAVVEEGRILSRAVASQIDIHRDFGGVVPELASREHLKKINIILEKCLEKGNLKFKDIGGIGVTSRPGLEGSLLVGLTVARTLAELMGVPLVEVDHLEGHLFSSAFVDLPSPPGIGLVISGGHTRLVYIKEWGNYRILGRTRDDAVGESFDKVASMLDLGYPGGPAIQKESGGGDRERFDFPVADLGNSLDFSYSGLKTSVLYKIKYDLDGELSDQDRKDIGASFQEAALIPLVNNTIAASKKYDVNWLFACGGVAASRRLRDLFKEKNIEVHFPPVSLCTDNGAMIAACGEFHLKNKSTR